MTPIKKRGQMMGPVPLWAEVAFAAVEDFTQERQWWMGSCSASACPDMVKEPIHWTFESGRCVKIEGGEEGRRLRRAIEGVENVEVAGEFAFGTSEKAPYGSPSEKGRIGTVHIALGDNHNAYPGGQNVCSLHLDGVFLNATMWIEDDDTYILRDGEWVLHGDRQPRRRRADRAAPRELVADGRQGRGELARILRLHPARS